MKLTQEQLAELIAKVFASITAKRKAAAEAGEEVPAEITTEDILAEVATILEAEGEGEEVPAEGAEGEGEEAKGEGECKEGDELIAKIIAALQGVKGIELPVEQKAAPAAGGGEKKSAPPAPAAAPAPTQRKYVNLFLNTGAARDGAPATDFKSRMAAMPVHERRRTAYGMLGRAVKCINAANGDIDHCAFIAERKFNDQEMAREFKALSATVPSDGGFLVPEIYVNEIIELLYPSTIIYALGARRLGMENGNLNIPKVKSGARAMFVGENRAISKSQPKFGNLKLSSKKLTALVPMSNDLLRSTNFDNDVIVGQDVTRQMALGVDYGAFFGTGGEFQPLGLVNNKKIKSIDVTSLDAAYADSNGVLTALFPSLLAASILKDNVLADGLGFAFNTSVEQFFKSLRDNVGGFIFNDEMTKQGTLMGYPYKTTNLFETSSTGLTKIVFGNWNDLVIGEQGALEIETSREATWTDDAGNLVSAFENDQTLIRAINHVDTGVRHEESFVVADKVKVPV